MRVMVLCYEYPPVGGGGGKAAEEIVKILIAKGHEVLVHTSYVKGLPKKETRGENYNIVRSFCFRQNPERCPVPQMLTYILCSAIPALFCAFKFKPDIIHVHFAVPTGPVAFFVSLFSGIPYVMTAHLGDVPGGVPEQTDKFFKLFKPFTVPIWKKASAVTAVSGFVAGLAQRAYHLKPTVIPNGLELPKDNPLPLEKNNSVPQLIFACRLNAQKQPLLLMDFLAMAKDIPWHLHVAGDGVFLKAMKEKAAADGITDRISFYGWVDNLKVDKLMSESDILLMPSSTEGFSVTAIKALKHRLAILASDIPSFDGIVENGKNGILCPFYDPKAFAEALRKLLADPDALKAMQKHSSELAPLYEINRITSMYEAVFRKVIDGGK